MSDDVNQAKTSGDKNTEGLSDPFGNEDAAEVVQGVCPACSGRGLIAVGIHDAHCAPCNGSGKVTVSDGVSEQAP